MNDLAPVALFVFNRPQHTRQTVEALRQNRLASESEVFVFCDGPRNECDRTRQTEILEYLESVSGFQRLEVERREYNFGLAKSITAGVSRITNDYGKIIVLEDDLVCSQHFLEFMNEGLNLLKNYDRVAAVHGYLPPINRVQPDPFFLHFVDCWGWGTWARAWQHFEPDGAKLFRRIREKNLQSVFDIESSFDYNEMLRKQVYGQIDSWAIRWYASIFLQGMLGAFPGRSLVRHIGWNEGTHHAESRNVMDSPLYSEAIRFCDLDVCEDKQARRQLKIFYDSLRPGLLSRVRNRLKTAFRRWKDCAPGCSGFK